MIKPDDFLRNYYRHSWNQTLQDLCCNPLILKAMEDYAKEYHQQQAPNLKLFVWDKFPRDYSKGIAVAFAENSEEARKLIIEKLGYNQESLCEIPREIKSKEGFY